MEGTALIPAPTRDRPFSQALGDILTDPLWHAPLVPVTLAATAGLAVDRYLEVNIWYSLLAALGGLISWLIAFRKGAHRLAVVFLWFAAAALGAGYHHWRVFIYPPDDIGNLVDYEPHPTCLRGVLEEEPFYYLKPTTDSHFRLPRSDTTMTVLGVTQMHDAEGWQPISGRARLIVQGPLKDLHIGDEVEVVGGLSAPFPPGNPGERDRVVELRDQRIRAVITVHKIPETVTRLAEGWPRSWRGLLAVFRGHCRGILERTIPQEKEKGLAIALLLGDGSALTSEDWDRYVRTGVVHVLVISGQQLAILGGVLWFILRRLGFSYRSVSLVVAGTLVAYAFLVGGQPPVMRSAAIACSIFLAPQVNRPYMKANTFALAWLVVGLLNPSDLANPGCQLSFLCVAFLWWGVDRWLHQPQVPLDQLARQTGPRWQRFLFKGSRLGWGVIGWRITYNFLYKFLSKAGRLWWEVDRWLRPPQDPLDRLVEQTRPTWQKLLFKTGRFIALSYAVTLGLWLTVIPLVGVNYNIVVPVNLLIGPPVVFLTSLALVAGFLLLLLSLVYGPLGLPFAWATRCLLTCCDGIVNLADKIPAGHWYIPDIPEWWLAIWYLLLLALVMLPSLGRQHWWLVLVGMGWLCFGLGRGVMPRSSEEFRCTFLAVGHGLCTVLETPDGHTFLYDAGAMTGTGPEVTRRQIAPFLWHRGIRRIDEVFLSHPDYDHFNGLPELLNRFAVGQVTYTELFPKKWEVQDLLADLERRQIPRREVQAGDRLHAGSVDLEVLHPPAHGEDGPENANSLVLLVTHAGHTLLLTGDLESPGLERLLSLPPPNIDILLAPHHGSRAANTPALAAWARPRVVVSSQGMPRSPAGVQEPYTRTGARYLATWPCGAVTVHSRAREMVVETFRSGERFVVPKRNEGAVTLNPPGSVEPQRPHVPGWPALAATRPKPEACPRRSGRPGRATNREIPGCAKCRPGRDPAVRIVPRAEQTSQFAG